MYGQFCDAIYNPSEEEIEWIAELEDIQNG